MNMMEAIFKDMAEKAERKVREQRAREHAAQEQRRLALYKHKDIYNLTIPPATLIFYYTRERDGAEQEKDDLTRALKQFNMTPIIKHDLTGAQILSTIREVQADENLTGMMVIIMSHGMRGAISTADVPLNINDILLQMNVQSLQAKPKMLLVQACQARVRQSIPRDHLSLDAITVAVTGCDARSAGPGVAAVNNHIDIRHVDFMLMMATIGGGTAHRNLMIPMLCKHLDKLGPQEDMYMAFLRTHREILSHVTENELTEQVAEFRSTLRKQVILQRTPPAKKEIQRTPPAKKGIHLQVKHGETLVLEEGQQCVIS